MTDIVSIKINGVADVQKQLYKFSEKLGDRVTRLALRSGANLMLKKVRAVEPKKTGRLRRATVVKNSRIHTRKRSGKIGVYITVRRGKTKKDAKGAYYAHIVERGYKKGKTAVPGKFFIRDTFKNTKQASAQLIIKNIETGGKSLAAKMK